MAFLTLALWGVFCPELVSVVRLFDFLFFISPSFFPIWSHAFSLLSLDSNFAPIFDSLCLHPQIYNRSLCSRSKKHCDASCEMAVVLSPSTATSILFLGCCRSSSRRVRQRLICWVMAVRFLVDRWILFEVCFDFGWIFWFLGLLDKLSQIRCEFSTTGTVFLYGCAAGAAVMVADSHITFCSVLLLFGCFVSGFGFCFGLLCWPLLCGFVVVFVLGLLFLGSIFIHVAALQL